jgi:hypothetical protein
MARFVRHNADMAVDDDSSAGGEAHPDLVARVQAYCQPMVPDRASPLSLREQHLRGFLFNRGRVRILSEGAAKR